MKVDLLGISYFCCYHLLQYGQVSRQVASPRCEGNRSNVARRRESRKQTGTGHGANLFKTNDLLGKVGLLRFCFLLFEQAAQSSPFIRVFCVTFT